MPLRRVECKGAGGNAADGTVAQCVALCLHWSKVQQSQVLAQQAQPRTVTTLARKIIRTGVLSRSSWRRCCSDRPDKRTRGTHRRSERIFESCLRCFARAVCRAADPSLARDKAIRDVVSVQHRQDAGLPKSRLVHVARKCLRGKVGRADPEATLRRVN